MWGNLVVNKPEHYLLQEVRTVHYTQSRRHSRAAQQARADLAPVAKLAGTVGANH